MKKGLIAIAFLLIAIAVVWTATYVIRDGEFSKRSHTIVMEEHFDNGEAMYLGYKFLWEGIGRPTLMEVALLKKDGTVLTQEDAFRIQPYVENSPENQIGALNEETVINDGLADHLLPLKGFKVDSNFRIVLRVEYDENQPVPEIDRLRITYKKFGVTRQQIIAFEGILIDES
ncbi:hypothetical protein QWT69_13290 [Sporosarcina oncorhynchi]|uniref:Uncharacterized protein n=1 Tax=Sporosarcina oncorhynchi TaxID=3056444 RepID=A0ABZ0L2S9_9BACL|nr:hypothetical protein [Sporosarcina sp. T2O-4]WOV86836.1 hypothetical protein QWT69_13290 [Sporosarcina sp. T2O-4]